jgi:hypothetical protein
LFPFVLIGVKEFANIFEERTKNTNLQHQNHRIQVPNFEEVKEDLQKCIDFWIRNIRENSIN